MEFHLSHLLPSHIEPGENRRVLYGNFILYKTTTLPWRLQLSELPEWGDVFDVEAPGYGVYGNQSTEVYALTTGDIKLINVGEITAVKDLFDKKILDTITNKYLDVNGVFYKTDEGSGVYLLKPKGSIVSLMRLIEAPCLGFPEDAYIDTLVGVQDCSLTLLHKGMLAEDIRVRIAIEKAKPIKTASYSILRVVDNRTLLVRYLNEEVDNRSIPNSLFMGRKVLMCGPYRNKAADLFKVILELGGEPTYNYTDDVEVIFFGEGYPYEHRPKVFDSYPQALEGKFDDCVDDGLLLHERIDRIKRRQSQGGYDD